MGAIELGVLAVFLCIGLVIYAINGPPDGSDLQDTNKGDHVDIDDLGANCPIESGECHALLIRQSGNVYRDLGVYPSAESALAEVTKSFRRAKVDTVRITFADGDKMGVYRAIYDFTGRAEGKKLAGAQLRLLTSMEADAD